MTPVHIPVMPAEVLENLALPEGPSFLVDGTLGEGGHASAFLERYSRCRILGLDADPQMGERAARRLAPWADRVEIRQAWADEVLGSWSGEAPDRILFDCGISTFHYQGSGRGFSFQGEEELDMRLDTQEGPSAADLLRELPQDELADLIYNYGEERYSRRIARRVVSLRKETPYTKAAQLAETVWRSVPPAARRGRNHPATRTFQALRVAVNHELDRLDALLAAAPGILAPGGRLGIISFHSLEDRRVKRAFRETAAVSEGEFFLVTKKPLVPSEKEILENPASRSAKFRVLERRGRIV